MRAAEKVTLSAIIGVAAACVLGLAVVSAAPEQARSAEARPATFSTRGQVMMLAADGDRVAVSTATKFSDGGRACPGRIVVWTPSALRSNEFKLDDYCGEYGGCFGVDELALGGGRVAWIEEAGGMSLELNLLAAPAAGGVPKQIENGGGDFCESHGLSSGTYIGQLFGAGPLLAWASWERECGTGGCPRGKRPPKTVVRLVGGLPAGVKNSVSSYGLVAVGGGRVAVASPDAIRVLAPNGTRLASVPAAGARRVQRGPSIQGSDALAVALIATRLAVERASTLELFDAATGTKARSFPLGKAARYELAGINAKAALLRNGSVLVLLRLNDGKRVSFVAAHKAQAKVVAVRLTEAGLFYAYNTPGAAMRGHIVFEPTAMLLRRF
jgi:hypothetical protein